MYTLVEICQLKFYMNIQIWSLLLLTYLMLSVPDPRPTSYHLLQIYYLLLKPTISNWPVVPNVVSAPLNLITHKYDSL